MHAGLRLVLRSLGILPLLVVLTSGVVYSADGELRTWSDTTGKFKIKAKFVSLAEGTVTLEREDGSELEIELKRLSAADQKVVADAVKAAEDNPFKSKAEADPFKPKTTNKNSTGKSAPGSKKASGGTKGAASKKSAADAPAADTRTVKVNLASAETISLAPPEETWKPKDLPEPLGFASKPKIAPLPNKTGFFEGVKGLAVSRVAGKAAVGFNIADPRPTGVTRVVLCDLKTGKTTPPAATPGLLVPIAVHDDGEQIVMRREEFGFGNQDRLEVWTLSGKDVAKTISWIPYEDVTGAPRDVMWAEFLDAEHLATSSRGGKVVIWKFPEIEAECTFDLVDGAVPGLSSDRRFIAYCSGSDVGIFDCQTRTVIAQQPTPEKLQWPYMAFSPSGKRIGCIAFDKILVWDVATGNLERHFPCPGLHIHGGIDFPDEECILANGKFLIELQNQLKFWTYDGHEQERSVAGWAFYAVTEGDKKPGALVPVQLPHAGAKDLLKKALNDPDLFVVKAGTQVKVNVDGIPPEAKERVQKALTQRLERIGCKGGANGTVELVALMEGPKDREIRFFHAGDYKMKEYITRVRFVFQGQPAWEASSTNVPFMVSLKKGENLEGHLRSREKPEYGFFDGVELPKFVQKPAAGKGPGGSLTLGQSRLSTGGIR